MPRAVWISLGSKPSSIFARKRRIATCDDVGIAVEVHVPHLRGDQRFGQHLAAPAQQQFQQGELMAVRSMR